MAVYIRFDDSEGVSPIIVGEMLTPNNYNWNPVNGRVDCSGDVVSGTGLISWWYTQDAGFKSFFDNNYVNAVSGTYYKDFKLYGNPDYKMRFQLKCDIYSGNNRFSEFAVNIVDGNNTVIAFQPYNSWRNMLMYYPKPMPDSIITDFLSGYGPTFVCNPHVQDTPTGLAVVYNYSNNMYNYNQQGYNPSTFCAFYDYGSTAIRTSIMDILFSKSGQSTGPDSDEGGGWGDFNDGTDNISLPGVPELSALSAGFVNMYNPTSAQLQVLVNALWSNDISQIFWKMLTSPMESLVSLQIFPVAPTVTALPVDIVMGNVTLQDQSTAPIVHATAPALTNQYKVFDCGSLNMNEYWGSALDYSPYSKAEIFLPYIGVKEIDINDVMAATLHLQYIVDFLTGTCTAQLQCVKAQHMDFSAPLYHWQGNMAMAIPATASDMSQLITSIASTLVSAGLTVATGGSGAVLAAGVAGGALNMANAHPRIEKGGTIAMTAGALDNQTPFIILTRPIQSKPANFNGFKGWPSNITASIGSLTGYTEIEYIHVEIDSATDEEKSEIERLLKEGVII